MSQAHKINHILGARKKDVYCYDFKSNEFLFKFEGLRIAARALNIKNYNYISYRLDKNKPLLVKFKDKDLLLLFKSKQNP